MPDQAQPDFSWMGDKLQPVAPPATAAPAQSAAPKPDFSWMGDKLQDKQEAAPSPAATAPVPVNALPPGGVQKESKDFFFDSILHTAGGPTIASIYDKLMKTNLPASVGKGYIGRLSVALGRALPESADFLTSPVGVALIVGHAVPWMRPFAAVADVALGGMQVANTAASTAQAVATKTPEDVAQAVKDAAFSGLMIKGFTAGKAKVGAAGIREMSADTPTAMRAADTLAQLKALAPVETDTKSQVTAKRRQQLDIITSMQPQGEMEKAAKTLYDSQFSGLAKVMGFPMPEGVQIGKMLVDERNRNIDSESFIHKSFSDQLRQDVPVEDRDVTKMGYAIQDPDTLQMTPEEMADKYDMSAKAAEWVQNYRRFNEEHTVPYLRSAHGSTVPLQSADTYLHQAWDFDKMADQGILEDPRSQGAFGGISRRIMKDPGLKKRAFARMDADGVPGGPGSYQQAIEEMGWIPKYRDVADIMDARNAPMVQAAENTRLANTFRGIGGLVRQDIGRARGVGDWPAAVDAAPLYQATYAGQKLRGEKATKGIILDKKPALAYPDFMHAINAVYADGLNMVSKETGKPTGWGYLEGLRQWGKQIGTMTSIFHPWSITAQSAANKLGNLSFTGNGSSPLSLAKSVWFTNPDFLKGAKTGIFKVVGKDPVDGTPIMRADPELVLDQIQHGVRLNSAENEEAVTKWLHSFEGTGIGSKALSKFGDVTGAFNKSTFDYYLTAEKMDVYNGALAKELPRLGPDATEEQVSALKRQVAEHVNRSFSTESLEQLLLHPKTRQMLSLTMFAPTWFINNMRQFTAGWENEAQARMKTRWLGGAALSFFMATQLANYATSSWFSKDDKGNHTWQGHYTWKNPGLPLQVGGKTYRDVSENIGKIYIGPNPDGSEAYATYGKPLSDGFTWMADPVKALGGKLTTWLKTVIAEATGREPGTSFSVIKSAEEGANPQEILVQRVAIALDPITPFWGENMKRILERKLAPSVVTAPRGQDSFLGNFTSGPYSAGLPISRGADISRAQVMYRHALENHDVDLMKAVLAAAQSNGLNVKTITNIGREKEFTRMKNERGPIVRPSVVPQTAPPPRIP